VKLELLTSLAIVWGPHFVVNLQFSDAFLFTKNSVGLTENLGENPQIDWVIMFAR
jgi:hypothetical protein